MARLGRGQPFPPKVTRRNLSFFQMGIDAAYERSSANIPKSNILGAGDAAVFSIFPRPIGSEVSSGIPAWLEPGVRVSGVNGFRPTFRFLSYLSSGSGENWSAVNGVAWQTGRRPMYSYDSVNWTYFDTNVTVDTTNHWIEFRNSTAFTSDVVYISRGRQVTVTQVGNWIAGLASSYSFISPTASAMAFTPSLCTGFPAQDYIADEFSVQTTELGDMVPPTPFYALQINDTARMPVSGVKKGAVVMCGVHAGEDLHAWPHNAFIEYICGNSAPAMNLRRDFKILCYPMMNAPGRYGGHWRGSFQTVSGADDLNRHFGDTTTLEIVVKPRTALLSDLSSATPVWQLDFHGDFGFSTTPAASYYTTSQRSIFRAAWEVYQGATYDEGSLPGGCTVEYFRTSLSCPYLMSLEFNDAVPLTDAALTTTGQNLAKAIADLTSSGTWPFGPSIIRIIQSSQAVTVASYH